MICSNIEVITRRVTVSVWGLWWCWFLFSVWERWRGRTEGRLVLSLVGSFQMQCAICGTGVAAGQGEHHEKYKSA